MTDQREPKDLVSEPVESAQLPATGPTPAGRTVAPSTAGRTRLARIWSNLNLNGSVPARVRPTIGEWGPIGLPSTKQKKRGRWIAPVAFVVMLCALVLLGWFFWQAFR